MLILTLLIFVALGWWLHRVRNGGAAPVGDAAPVGQDLSPFEYASLVLTCALIVATTCAYFALILPAGLLAILGVLAQERVVTAIIGIVIGFLLRSNWPRVGPSRQGQNLLLLSLATCLRGGRHPPCSRCCL